MKQCGQRVSTPAPWWPGMWPASPLSARKRSWRRVVDCDATLSTRRVAVCVGGRVSCVARHMGWKFRDSRPT
eukprot:4641383-Prymnesium_polylepis.1